MNITFKTTWIGLANVLDRAEQRLMIPYTTREQKVVGSIMEKVEAKLLKKCIDKRNTEKEFKIKLDYYEAFALEKMCRSIYEICKSESDIFTANEALMIANEIDKQL